MNIKQQKPIKAYLTREFGKEKGSALYDKQEKILAAMIENTIGKTANQMKTLAQTILPRIAMYKALLESDFPKDEVYVHMRKYMIDVVAAKSIRPLRKWNCSPGFTQFTAEHF